jgi:hypothetical protein
MIIVSILALISLAGNAWLLVRLSTYDGSMAIEVDDDNEPIRYSFEFDGDPYDIKDMNKVVFKVDKHFGRDSQ